MRTTTHHQATRALLDDAGRLLDLTPVRRPQRTATAAHRLKAALEQARDALDSGSDETDMAFDGLGGAADRLARATLGGGQIGAAPTATLRATAALCSHLSWAWCRRDHDPRQLVAANRLAASAVLAAHANDADATMATWQQDPTTWAAFVELLDQDWPPYAAGTAARR